MNTLETIIVNSTLTRLLANIFLFIMVVGSAGMAGYELLMGKQPDMWVVMILGAALGSSIKILGISAGATLAKAAREETT